MQRAVAFAISVIAMAAVHACPTRADPPEGTADPVASLKVILKRVSDDGTKERVTDFTGPGKWSKRKRRSLDLQYDVTKTDSLVSPFTASVTWADEGFYTTDFATREEAQASPLPAEPSFVSDRPGWWAKLAFQEGRWVVKDVGWDAEGSWDDPLMHQRYSKLGDVRRPILDWWLAFGGAAPTNLAAMERAASEAARQRRAEEKADDDVEKQQNLAKRKAKEEREAADKRAMQQREERETARKAHLADREGLAATRLQLAKALMAANPEKAKKRLTEITQDYSGTAAAKEAKELLEKLE